MRLAIFDLDNTLLGGDSDYLWGEFLIEQGVVERDYYARENDRFYAEYKAGTLDIRAYQRFSLAPIIGREEGLLAEWHREYMRRKIEPIILPASRELLRRHREAGDFLLIITATNRFVTAPIAAELGVDELLATEPEVVGGAYTGEITGIPCFQGGKVQRLKQWLEQTGFNLADSCFYSDSHNDLPLLDLVTRPVAVDPDPTLEDHAQMKGWEVITLRSGAEPRPLARPE